MATFDFSPMFRSGIGFDELPDLLAHAAEREATGYPPYNIEKRGPDAFRIVIAVAGFAPDDLDIVQAENRLIVKGRAAKEEAKTFLFHGLATRSFVREFDLATYVDVTGAELENGLLIISLKRELPETMKPRSISIAVDDRATTAAKAA
jgi:molecular chaperone IbpA